MNNLQLSSYYGLTDSRMSASDTDLPINTISIKVDYYMFILHIINETLSQRNHPDSILTSLTMHE